jgi:hypothetical protein
LTTWSAGTLWRSFRLRQRKLKLARKKRNVLRRILNFKTLTYQILDVHFVVDERKHDASYPKGKNAKYENS